MTNKIKGQANSIWLEKASKKRSLTIYLEYKKNIQGEVNLYNNEMGSKLLADARGGGLKTRVYYKKFKGGIDIKFQECGAGEENVEHILFECKNEGLKELRNEPERMAIALGFIKVNNQVNEFTKVTKSILQKWYFTHGINIMENGS